MRSLKDRQQRVSNLIVPAGTQVVLRPDLAKASSLSPEFDGAVAEVITSPDSHHGCYTVRSIEGVSLQVSRQEFSILKQIKSGQLDPPMDPAADDLRRYVIYRCIVGSQAHGLSRDQSDVDRRGIYLPPADFEWSIYGIPEQLEMHETEECYWEIKKFLLLALKANPNILECLFTPIVEYSTEIADALRRQREIFLSKLVYQTYSGYVMSQFKKLEQDLRTHGAIKWKHAMHLIRLLLQGVTVLQEGHVPVQVTKHRDALLAIKDGNMSWQEVDTWRLELHREFQRAFQNTRLPDTPNYDAANQLLIWARREMVDRK